MTDIKENKASKNDTTPVKLKLSMGHTHRGEDFSKGDTINLCKYQAVRLQKAKVGEIVNG